MKLTQSKEAFINYASSQISTAEAFKDSVSGCDVYVITTESGLFIHSESGIFRSCFIDSSTVFQNEYIAEFDRAMIASSMPHLRDVKVVLATDAADMIIEENSRLIESIILSSVWDDMNEIK